MTPRERVEAALLGQRPDRVPFTVYENKLPTSEAERRLRDQGLCIVERRTPAYLTRYRETVEEAFGYTGSDGAARIRLTYRTPVGELTAVDRPVSFTSWHEKRLFTAPADYEPLECLIRDRFYLPNYEAFAKTQTLLGGDGFLRAGIGYEPLMEIILGFMGVEEFSVQWAENRGRLLRLHDVLIEDRRKLYDIVAGSPALAVNYGGNVSPEVVGLQRFERYILPQYEEAAEVLHAKGKLIGVHFDANTRLLASGIARSSLDYIEAFTPRPTCDMTVAEARQAWPGKVLWINFPSSVHLESLEVIAATTLQILREAGPGDRFLIGITEDVPEERWQANFETIMRVMGYR
jgi:hypothetical protein